MFYNFILLEKDINACNLDVKNETSWTSWAMTSLSAKITDYKSKSGKQQASVALSSTGESKKAIENSSTNKQSESAAKEETKKLPTKVEVTDRPEDKVKFSSPFESSFDAKPKEKSNDGGGWGGDDWQEFADDDEDDQMEPLEPFSKAPTFNNPTTNTLTSAKKTTTTISNNTTSSNKASSNAGWDAFDDNESVNSTKSNKSSAASSTNATNWSTQSKVNSLNDEEALFSALVKDVSK